VREVLPAGAVRPGATRIDDGGAAADMEQDFAGEVAIVTDGGYTARWACGTYRLGEGGAAGPAGVQTRM
jgi:hypothetical protein